MFGFVSSLGPPARGCDEDIAWIGLDFRRNNSRIISLGRAFSMVGQPILQHTITTLKIEGQNGLTDGLAPGEPGLLLLVRESCSV